jgi:hypothetical protein
VTLHARGYDTPALPVAAVFLVRAAPRGGWLPGEKALLLVACLLPTLLVLMQHPLVAPAAWGAVLALASRRDAAWRQGQPGAGVSPVAPPATRSAGT